MDARDLCDFVSKARQSGRAVQIKVPIYSGLEPVDSMEPVGGDWILLFQPGVDVEVLVPLSKVEGLRVMAHGN